MLTGPLCPVSKSRKPCSPAKAPEGSQAYTLDVLWFQKKKGTQQLVVWFWVSRGVTCIDIGYEFEQGLCPCSNTYPMCIQVTLRETQTPTQWNLTGCSTTARRLCHRSAIFFRHVLLAVLSLPQGKVFGTHYEDGVISLSYILM